MTLQVTPPSTYLNNPLDVTPPNLSSGGGGTITTDDEGVLLSATTNELDFVGTGVQAVATTASKTTVTIPGAGSAGGQFNWGLFIAGTGCWPQG